MCFGMRISSPFHLNTLNIPIQNINCPKNAKNACADIIEKGTLPWSLNRDIFDSIVASAHALLAFLGQLIF